MMLQKPVPPGVVKAYLGHGFDRVSGWVMDAADLADVTDIDQLRRIHHLDYAHSPYPTGEPLHILHVPAPPATPLVRANPSSMSELFELPEDGVVVDGEIRTPMLWLEHTRLPAGSRLWRFTPGEEGPTLAGTYHGPAFGWQDDDGTFIALPPSIMAGRVAIIDGKAYTAEPELDEAGHPVSVTVATFTETEGFEQTESGLWAKAVPFDEVEVLFESHVQGIYRELPVRVVERFDTAEGSTARIASLALDHGANLAAGFDLIEAGTWEASVPWDEVSDIEPTQRVAKAWVSEEDLKNSTPIHAQDEAEQRMTPPSEATGDVNAFAQPPSEQATVTISQNRDDAPPVPPQLQEIYIEIIRAIAENAPAEAERVELLVMVVNTSMQVAAQAILPNDQVIGLPDLPQAIVDPLTRLRVLTYHEERGAWFSAAIRMTPEGQFTVNVNTDEEPPLRQDFPAAEWRADLERFPRSEEHIPDWLRAKLEED
ncbi:MAG: hypothetical protein Q4P36_04220 [Bowdeniella nasicola]|nr:hypothetical protein [Bowdeniella nasicola]